MFKFVFATLAVAVIACSSMVDAAVVAPFAYAANAPLYAAGGSSQVDIRNNYDGTLSSYTTAPFNYAGPFASRYVSGVPVTAPLAATPLAAPLTAAPLAAATPFAAAAPLAATAPFAARYAAGPAIAAAPFAAAPFAAAPFAAAPFAAAPAFF